MPFLLGKFNCVTEQLFEKIGQRTNSQIIFPTTLHELALKNSAQNKFSYQNVDFCTNDSMILTYFFRCQYDYKIDRVYGPDLMLAILDKNRISDYKFKNFFLSADQSTMKKMQVLFREKYPQMLASYSFLPKNISVRQERSFLKKIDFKKTDIVWLGIGSPKQIELASYLKKNVSRISIFCVGAAFDFITGQKRQAPSWIQKSGLEWLFRLLNEPKRLWRRYLLIIPKYLFSYVFRSFIKVTRKSKKK